MHTCRCTYQVLGRGSHSMHARAHACTCRCTYRVLGRGSHSMHALPPVHAASARADLRTLCVRCRRSPLKPPCWASPTATRRPPRSTSLTGSAKESPPPRGRPSTHGGWVRWRSNTISGASSISQSARRRRRRERGVGPLCRTRRGRSRVARRAPTSLWRSFKSGAERSGAVDVWVQRVVNGPLQIMMVPHWLLLQAADWCS